jgi:hypothetical protein
VSSRYSSRSIARRRARIASKAPVSTLDRLTAFQRAFEDVLGPVLGQPWCVEATRVAQLALGDLGVAASPVFTRLRVMNAAAVVENCGRETAVPPGQRPATKRFGWRDLGGFADGEVGFSGHLAVVAAGYLFDGAIAQCRSRERGLWAPATILSPRDFLKDGRGTLYVTHEGVETGIEYERVAPSPFVFTTPAWTASDVRHVASVVAREAKRRL